MMAGWSTIFFWVEIAIRTHTHRQTYTLNWKIGSRNEFAAYSTVWHALMVSWCHIISIIAKLLLLLLLSLLRSSSSPSSSSSIFKLISQKKYISSFTAVNDFISRGFKLQPYDSNFVFFFAREISFTTFMFHISTNASSHLSYVLMA